jgi:hypothetical protein
MRNCLTLCGIEILKEFHGSEYKAEVVDAPMRMQLAESA